MKKWVVMILLTLAATGCSRYASNGESLYLQSRNNVLPNVPAPLTSSNISHFYVLPQQTQDPRVSITPPGVNASV